MAASPPGPIDFYFDFSSPYGYFAAMAIDEAAAGWGRAVRWRPMMLGPALQTSGNRPLVDQPLKGDYAKHDWARFARFMKLPWRLPEPFPVAALAPARAFYWLHDDDEGLAKAFARAAFTAYFGDGRDISEAAVTADVAASVGVAREPLLAAIGDPAVKEKLKRETADAIARGVFGSPIFVVDGELFWGADRLWMIKRWIERGGW
jgi:2-hydroxychromene-2-carboxylate isomerase